MLVYRDNPRIDFRTRVDWHEHQVLLKVAFPVAVRSTRATYEIQFGSVERPTHWNTSWDWARFEVPGHKWVDLSEGDYGVAILNDCKYGHDVKGNLMRLTLIKSGINPDPTADQGEHIFTYSLLPHAGDWRSAGVVEAAYELNYPLLAAALPAGQPGDLPENLAFAEVDARNVIVETLKQAEDGQGWIVRVYEAKQCRSSQVRLKFARPLTAAVECNLVEEEERPVEWDEQGIRFAIRPFEIKTFRVNFA
ncbi:MAG TPA: glycoside hydrolase family 38 C-terminal domain-containing protein [Anaerolineaceae bacterium]|nr:glycoside hydrolase family 38 C-terminal domain-containing protein [Anaerolineaceae bacterium]